MSKHDWYNLPVTDIPRPPKATTPSMQRSYDVIDSLKPGVGAAVPVPEGKLAKGLKSSLSKAAKALGVQVVFTEANGMVYVELVDK
jgi:hypothetical protein